MLSLYIRFRGLQEAISRIRRLRKVIPKAAGEEVGATALEVSKRLAESISTPWPPASTPGEPPHKRTGALLASVGVTGSGLTREVGTGTHYARYLEHGTSKMAARPHVEPQLDGAGETLCDRLAARIQREL